MLHDEWCLNSKDQSWLILFGYKYSDVETKKAREKARSQRTPPKRAGARVMSQPGVKVGMLRHGNIRWDLSNFLSLRLLAVAAASGYIILILSKSVNACVHKSRPEVVDEVLVSERLRRLFYAVFLGTAQTDYGA